MRPIKFFMKMALDLIPNFYKFNLFSLDDSCSFFKGQIHTKLCIKYAPYLHFKSANRALKLVLFDALVLKLFSKFVPNRTIEGAISAVFFNFVSI